MSIDERQLNKKISEKRHSYVNGLLLCSHSKAMAGKKNSTKVRNENRITRRSYLKLEKR